MSGFLEPGHREMILLAKKHEIIKTIRQEYRQKLTLAQSRDERLRLKMEMKQHIAAVIVSEGLFQEKVDNNCLY